MDYTNLTAILLESIYPTKAAEITSKIENVSYVRTGAPAKSSLSIVKPRVLIPAFPGTNCEYDAARAFDRAGAESTIKVFRNLYLPGYRRIYRCYG